MHELRGRVAVVTGAASGIGRALAERLAAEGMTVVLSDIEQPALDAAVQEMRDRGAEVTGVRADVSSQEDVHRVAEHAVRAYGAVHVICNNAGVDGGASFAEIPLETWDWVFRVNFWGVLHGCRAFLPILRKQDAGHIVNTASYAALSGFFPAGTPYVASKFAVLGLSENLFHELAANGEPIGVSVLCPSFVDTRMPLSDRNRPPWVPSTDGNPAWRAHVAATRTGAAAGLPASQVAAEVIDAIRHERFFVLPHVAKSQAAVEARVRWMLTNEPPSMTGESR